MKRLLDDKIEAHGLSGFYTSTDAEIRGPNGSLFVFAGLRTNPDSIKSMEGIDRAAVFEANRVSQRSLDLLIPTVRNAGSELWFEWNPEDETDPVDAMFRGAVAPPDSLICPVSWRDNPFFPPVLMTQMDHDRINDPERFAQVWDGGYRLAVEGAYFAKQLQQARDENRIGKVAPDPLMQYRAFWDIGTRDHTAIWVAQFVGREIRVIDYYEASGQPLGTHLAWIRDSGYASALCVLPHDGANVNHITATGFDDHIRSAGFTVDVVKNQGKGAAMMRVEAARRLFPSIWFNEDTTRDGIKALSSYHERRDPDRKTGLGPKHDWSSHGADAFGLMCVAYEEPRIKRPARERAAIAGGWMT